MFNGQKNRIYTIDRVLLDLQNREKVESKDKKITKKEVDKKIVKDKNINKKTDFT